MPTGAFNAWFGPAPIQTPMVDDHLLPTVSWAAWFSAIGSMLRNSPLVMDLTLTAASTTVNTPTTGMATELVVILRQDNVGGRNVVWGTGFVADSSNLDTTASTVSTFRFVYSSSQNQWVMAGQPTTGMVP